MVERSTISQTVAIGVEATPGTPVAATKRLGSIGFQIGVQIQEQTRRPVGQKYSSLETLGKEWTEADIDGSPCYTELPYLYSSLISTPTVTQIMDNSTATGAWKWVFDSNTFGTDAPKTFTLEQGSSARAHRVSNGIVTDLTMSWDREELGLDGTLLAKALEDGITMTSGPTQLPQIPVLPKDVSIFLDDTAANLGTTKLLRSLSGEIGIESRYAPLWVVDSDQTSFVNTIEDEPDVHFTLLQMADQQAMNNLVAMRGGATKFVRFISKGPVIYTPGTGTAIRHQLTFDMAGQVSDVGQFDDEDGVYAIEWTFGGVHDPTWGKAYHVELITTTSAL